MFSFQKLAKLADKIYFILDILPASKEDTVYPRHKRMLFSVLTSILVKEIAKDIHVRNTSAQAEIQDLEAQIEALSHPPVTESPNFWEFSDFSPTPFNQANIRYRGKRQLYFMAISPLKQLGRIFFFLFFFFFFLVSVAFLCHLGLQN